jgi:hypothetical protein
MIFSENRVPTFSGSRAAVRDEAVVSKCRQAWRGGASEGKSSENESWPNNDVAMKLRVSLPRNSKKGAAAGTESLEATPTQSYKPINVRRECDQARRCHDVRLRDTDLGIENCAIT